jgi:hypothetical protein
MCFSFERESGLSISLHLGVALSHRGFSVDRCFAGVKGACVLEKPIFDIFEALRFSVYASRRNAATSVA